jgi:hypothetical protein
MTPCALDLGYAIDRMQRQCLTVQCEEMLSAVCGPRTTRVGDP